MTLAGRCALVLVPCFVLACSEGPVRRTVPLVAEDGLPVALSVVVGDSARLEISRLEALKTGHSLYAWARSGSAWTGVGEVSVGVTTFTGPAWASVEELLVTVEGETVASTPSAAVVFRGRLGEPLAFGGPGGPSLQALGKATVKAEISDLTMTTHLEGLPVLGAGAYYGVWVGGAPMPDMPGMEPEKTYLGRLGADDSELTGDELLAAHEQVQLTIELEDGVDTQGSVVMRGKMLGNPGAAPAAEAPTHQH